MKLMIYDLETRMTHNKKRGYRKCSINWIRNIWYHDFIRPAMKCGEIHKRNQSVYLLENRVYKKYKDASSNFKDTILNCIARRINSLKGKKFKSKEARLFQLKERKNWLMKNDFNYSFEFFEAKTVHLVNKKEVLTNVRGKSCGRIKRKEKTKR